MSRPRISKTSPEQGARFKYGETHRGCQLFGTAIEVPIEIDTAHTSSVKRGAPARFVRTLHSVRTLSSQRVAAAAMMTISIRQNRKREISHGATVASTALSILYELSTVPLTRVTTKTGLPATGLQSAHVMKASSCRKVGPSPGAHEMSAEGETAVGVRPSSGLIPCTAS